MTQPSHPGDDIVPAANMIFDRSRQISAAPEVIWPWLLQLGKQRAGWYMPQAVERFLPPQRRAMRSLNPWWHRLQVGDRIPDYGSRGAELEVAEIHAPAGLIYRDERRGAQFSWAITLTAANPDHTNVHLRFRGRLASTGPRLKAMLVVGEFFDGLTGELMLRGLQERVTGASGRAGRSSWCATAPSQRPRRWRSSLR